jgi:2'-5' RNA ligase
MDAVRTFVAVLIDEDLRNRITEVQGRIKKLAPDVKWVAPENLHVTLKFLGDVREDLLPKVFLAVEEAVQGLWPFNMSVSGIGAFPNARRARVVWIGLEDGEDRLRELAISINEKLAKLNFEREENEFKAHITIERVKTSRFLDELAKGLVEVDARNLGVQRVSSIAVMKSDLRRDGPIYTPLKIIELSQRGVN